MLIPSRFENLEHNTLVLGADILLVLKDKPYNIESLYQKLKHKDKISLDIYLDVVSFLWLMDFVEYDNFHIILKK